MNKNDNMRIYEEVRNVPIEAQKKFNNGRFSGTDINPMWRIKKLTEVFGPCGIGWYVKVVNREVVHCGETGSTFVGVELYVKENGEWSMPIYGEGGNTLCERNKYDKLVVSDEAYKMAYTDAISNAAKMLGVGADVWFENDKQHSTKYDKKSEDSKAAVATSTPDEFEKYKASMDAANDNATVNSLWASLSAAQQADERYKAVCVNKCKELKKAA